MACKVASERVVMYACPVVHGCSLEYLLRPSTLCPPAHDRARRWGRACKGC